MTELQTPSHLKRSSLGQVLALGTLRGLWTLEQLDQPPASRRSIESAVRRQCLQRGQSLATYRNLAREWIAAHSAEWEAHLLRSLDAERLDHLPTGPEILAAAAGAPAELVSAGCM